MISWDALFLNRAVSNVQHTLLVSFARTFPQLDVSTRKDAAARMRMGK